MDQDRQTMISVRPLGKCIGYTRDSWKTFHGGEDPPMAGEMTSLPNGSEVLLYKALYECNFLNSEED